MLEVLVLGAVEARVDGNTVPLGGAKQRALLARLVTRRGRALSAAQLRDELWAHNPPRDPVHALQARVSRLRSALPVDIELVGGGYRLDPAGIDTDEARFTQLREQAAALADDGALAQASERLAAALSLRRGPALADVSGIPALEAESMRLEEAWAAARADRIDIDLALGRAEQLVPELSTLVREHPYRERHWAQLMLALYATGRVHEALEAFAQAREAAVELSGTEPGDALSHLHLAILREQPYQSLLPAPGRTGEHVAGAAAGEDSGRIAGERLTSNRADVLAARLSDHQALLVTGPAGIGRSHLLRALRQRLEGEQRVVPLLAGNRLGQDMPFGAFASALGDDRGEGTSIDEVSSPAAIIDHFARDRSRAALLVDDVGLLDESSLFVVTQLVRSARVPVVMTARDVTGAPAEIRALYDSGALAEAPVESLTDAEARDLAAQLAPGPLTPDARTRILRVAAGNPLHLREVIDGSRRNGRLVETEDGWELQGEPAPTPRLAQLVGARFDMLDAPSTEAVALVAIAGELPADALAGDRRAALTHHGLFATTEAGWLRLAQPLDREVLQRRVPEAQWRELTREAVALLGSDAAAARPQARRRAHLLALDLDDPIDIAATVMLAERALAAFDEPLALRAAQAVVDRDPENADAHRIMGLAASTLGDADRADRHFDAARAHARNDAARAAAARAHAQHRGLRLHDAAGALRIIDEAWEQVTEPDERAHLQRARMRWAAVAGMGGAPVGAPALTADAADAVSLLTVGASAVITGPLAEAERVLAQLRRVPAEIIDRVPGGAALVALTEVMALSYSGDIVATERLLRQRIADAEAHAPETVGMWEYAYGFSELFAGDAATAYALADAAASHLRWRDTTGVLPAAQALAAAAASATGRAEQAEQGFAAIAESAAADPKVVMLKAWANAGRTHRAGRAADAARTLIDTAQWLVVAQHTFFAGMLAHCAVRTGHLADEARAIIDDAAAVGGGGLMNFFVRHADASTAADPFGLDVVAREARELGMVSTAVDTWLALDDIAHGAALSEAQRGYVGELKARHPSLVCWRSESSVSAV